MTWPYRRELDAAARVAADAIEELRLSIDDGSLIQEPEMNGAFASHLASAFRKTSIQGISWTGRHLRAAGADAEENKVGADLAIAIEIEFPHFSQSKGLLIQNKRDGTDYRKELLSQIDKMEDYTDSAWLCVLSGRKIRFDSANTVRGRKGKYGRDLARIPAYTFFRDFFQCEIGDLKLPPSRARNIFREVDAMGIDAVLLKASKG